MEYSRSRVLGLANGTVEPESGLEKHFVRVCQGTATPVSAIESEWQQIVKEQVKVVDDLRNSAATQPMSLAKSQDFDVAGRLQKLQQEFSVLTLKHEELKDELYVSREQEGFLHDEQYRLNFALHEQKKVSIKQYDDSVRIAQATEKKLHSEVSDAQTKLGHLQGKLAAAEHELGVFRKSIEAEIQRLLPQVIRDIQEENKRVIEYNKKFSEKNQLLAEELRVHISVRVKCNVCDGVGKWVDKGTFRVGADYDGPNAVEVCSNCRGAGFLANPKREELGILPLNLTRAL